MNSPKYLDRCPIGCDSELKDTDILLPEGCLKVCSHCGQLISQCSEQSFHKSMEEFNDPKGTWPLPKPQVALSAIPRKS